eukprot:TRINITY_DN8587_c0_g1_i1.p1 TRINITY_DN8587_c0_g1~~TRINITY_DN8587_c0_g1_i1.p1  ORF type:complete len:305 (-),score=72.09 TRINITY_DN8587_c0_g1_i1:201-1115(-)
MSDHHHEKSDDDLDHHGDAQEVDLPYFEGCDHPDLAAMRHALQDVGEFESQRRARGGQSNTGPKGVLADYKEYQRELQRGRELEQQNRNKAIIEMARSLTLSGQPNRSAGDDQDEDEDEEDEFMKEYRLKRLSELSSYYSCPRFGRLLYVSAQDFVDKVDEQPAGVRVVVHLFEHQIKVCNKINKCLESIARDMTHVLFLAVVASDAKRDYDSYGLPTIIIYHQGEVQSSIIRVHEQLDREFVDEDLNHLLVRHGVSSRPEATQQTSVTIQSSKTNQQQSSIRGPSESAFSRADDEEEDDDDYK